ncbi:MAG TPA: SEC-C metal-binding domain-containing protein, partial [Streptosporangiaceae bacterium]|nr:SEC-C metal-binding domain-containing protein [Streptosporangiaceae bacterium]
AMMDGIKEESVGSLFNLQVEKQESPIVEDAVADGDFPAAALDGGAFGGPVPGGAGPGGPVLGPAAGRGAHAAPSNGRQARSGLSRPAAAGGQAERGRADQPGPGQAGQPGQASRSGQPGQAGRSGRQGQRGSHARQGGAHARSDPGAATNGPATPAGLAGRGMDRPQRPSRLEYSAPRDDASGRAEQRSASRDGVDYSKVGRNAPCPCGSGRKFKQCHGDPRNR